VHPFQLRRIILPISAALFSLFLTAAPEIRAAFPDDAPAVQAAKRQFDAGNYNGAISTLHSAVGSSSSNAAAYYWLGRCYYELHDYDAAIENGEKSVMLDPKNSEYHIWLGQSYGGKADKDHSFFIAKKVKKEFQQAVQLDPGNVVAREDLEEFDLQAPWIVGGNKDEAHDQATAVAQDSPVEGHIALGKFDEEGPKHLDQAETEFRAVLAAKPSQVDPYLEVIQFYQRQDRAMDMLMAVDAASQASPQAASDPRIAFYRAVALVMSNSDLNHAEEFLKSYIASTPDRSNWPPHAAAREWLGRLYEAQGKPGPAAEQYRAALQLDPGRKQARARLEKLEKNSQ
jgi:tetratricopeptide (TPR) repeat protein